MVNGGRTTHYTLLPPMRQTVSRNQNHLNTMHGEAVEKVLEFPRGHSHIGSYQGCAARMGEFSRPKAYGWV